MAADTLADLIRLNLAASLGVCVMLLRAPTRRLFGPGPAYALWLAVPLASAAAFLPARTVSPLVPPGLPIESVARLATDWTVSSAPVATAPATVDLPVLLLALWLAGAVIGVGVVTVLHRRSLARLGRLHATGEAALLRSEGIWSGPAVIGALRPRIVVPADFEERFTRLEQEMVLAHERIHIARADAVINAAVVLVQCLNWMNPLVHLGARLLRLDQEMACDAAVIERHPDSRRAYAQAMLKTQLAPMQSPLGCYWPARGPNPLKERFAMLKRDTSSRRRRTFGAAAVSVIVAGAGFGAWASNDEVRVRTQDIVEAATVPLPVRVTRPLPTVAEQSLAPAPTKIAAVKTPAVELRRAVEERPLTETEKVALTAARAAFVQAEAEARLGLISKSEIAARAARLAELELVLGQKSTVAEEALRLAEADLADKSGAYDVGTATQSDIGLAIERLVRLQLALGRKPSEQSMNQALDAARRHLEEVRVSRYEVGLSTQADIAAAAERLRQLEALAKP